MEGRGESYDPTGPLSFHLQRIFLHLLADHTDCAYESNLLVRVRIVCKGGEGGEL